MSSPERLTRLLAVAIALHSFAGCADARRQQQGAPQAAGLAEAEPAAGSPRTTEISFEDMQPDSGIRFPLSLPADQDVGIKETIGHAAALFDFDGDGLLDVLLTGPNRVTLFRNNGGWKFERIASSGFRQQGNWQGVAVGDLNGDARPDVFLSGFGCSALYLNDGGRGFRDVTVTAGFDNIPADRWQTSAACADVDHDGLLDLYVTCYVDLGGKTGACTYPGGIVTACNPKQFSPQQGILYRNLGEVRFADLTSEYGLDVAHGNGLGAAFGDPNNDGYPDLYLANDQLPCDLFINERGRRFENWGMRSGTAFRMGGAVQAGMGVDFGDYDNDGREDLVVSNYLREPTSLYHNEGDLVFSNTTDVSNIGPATTNSVGWGVKWVDLDNDGWLDLVIANGHPLHRIKELDGSTEAQQKFQVFRNQGGGRFVEVPSLGDTLPRIIAGRAVCAGDLDNDGHVDLLISHIEGEPLVLRNKTGGQNHWMTIRLVGTTVTEGSLVVARAGSRKWIRRSTTGGSYLATSDSRVHLGLGTLTELDELQVHWPGGKTTVLKDVPADREVVVTAQSS